MIKNIHVEDGLYDGRLNIKHNKDIYTVYNADKLIVLKINEIIDEVNKILSYKTTFPDRAFTYDTQRKAPIFEEVQYCPACGGTGKTKNIYSTNSSSYDKSSNIGLSLVDKTINNDVYIKYCEHLIAKLGYDKACLLEQIEKLRRDKNV